MLNLFPLRKVHFGVLLVLSLIFFQQVSFSQVLLDPETQEKFENTLPVIKDLGLRLDATSSKNYNASMVQITQHLGLQIEGYTGSTVWAYQFDGLPATYPGATIVAKRDKKVKIKWENNLPGHFLPVDASLHMAHPDYLHTIPEIRSWYEAGNVPAVTHLHGGHTESASDGLPEAWFTQGFSEKGKYWEKKRYVYDNDQEAATLWYHDHALGITRMNVYMGLAGFYLLRDDNEENLINTGVLPGGDYEIEIVIQDRMFDSNGELFWPAYPGDPAYDDFITGEGADLDKFDLRDGFDHFPGGGPTALAEFFGDFILVNGMAWPKLEVEPRKYRFRLLNGSDSRFYVLEFRNTELEVYSEGSDLSFLQVGTENGLLPQAVGLDQLLIAPGERMDLVVDFSQATGSSVYLRNFGPDEPYGGGEPVNAFTAADPSTTGQIMRFDIVGTVPTTDAAVELGTSLRPDIASLEGLAGTTRQLALFEGMDEYGRLMPMLGTVGQPDLNDPYAMEGTLTWSDPITENPMKDDIEIWEVYNATGDAHPIHLHLVSFQILDRTPFTAVSEGTKDHFSHAGEDITGGWITVPTIDFPDATNVDDGVEPNERGWKDTAVMLPGEVTRVVAKFDREGRYVWHCHILSHEDHEMMRPFHVGPPPLPKQSGDVIAAVSDYSLEQNYPNPFNPSTTINFSVPEENTLVSLKIYSSLGEEVGTLINQVVPAGNHEVQFDATSLPSGAYFYTLSAGNFVETKKMMLMK